MCMYNTLYLSDKNLLGGTQTTFYRSKYYERHPAYTGKKLSAFGMLEKLSPRMQSEPGVKKSKPLLITISEDDRQKHPYGSALCDRPFWMGQGLVGLGAARRQYVCLKVEEATEARPPTGA